VRAPPSCISEASQGQLLQGSIVQRRLAETALTAVVQEAYVHGVSTRSFDDVLQTMGRSGVSKNQVSRLSANVDEQGIPASADRR
jgi:transposase-like protein